MNIVKSVALMKKFNNCLACGSSTVGNGSGSVHVEDGTFYRSCKCGWSIKTDEDGKEIKK